MTCTISNTTPPAHAIRRALEARVWLPSLVVLASVFNLLLARLLTMTDGGRVWLAGAELHGACPVQNLYGMPCPFCGITRSIIFTLHGEIKRAVELNPAGVLLVLGVILACGAGALLAARRQNTSAGAPVRATHAQRTHNRLAIFFAIYATLILCVMFGHWLRHVAGF